MIALVVMMVIVVGVVLAVRGLPVQRPDPIREIAQAKAREAIQTELFEQRSRLRAAEAERAAKAAMSSRRK